jgi:hypothetical protein
VVALALVLALPPFSPRPSWAVEPFCPGGSMPDPHVLWCDDFEDGEPLGQKYFDYDSSDEKFILTQLPRYRDRSTYIPIGCTACE